MSTANYEVIEFHYTANEYHDGEVYIPAINVQVNHNQGDYGTLPEVVEAFKRFLLGVGYLNETVDRIVILGPEAANEESF
jgi:hypothetical protein